VITYRLILDENVSESVAVRIASHFGAVLHARAVLGTGVSDDVIWRFARREKLVLVTRDGDFERMSMMYGPPPKVVWVGEHNIGNARLAELLLARKPSIDRLVSDSGAGFLALRA
jgi:predicted nuclease of predicted toxin-antitoxin system